MNALFLLAVVTLSQERLVVVNKSDSTLSVLERDSGKSLAVIPVGKIPHEVAVTPDSKWAFTSDYDNKGQPPGHTVTVVDLIGLKPAGTIELSPNNKPHGIAVSGDGKWLWVTCEGSSTVLKIEVKTRKIVSTIDTGDSPTHLIALDEKNGRAYATSIKAGVLVVIDTAKASIVKKVPCGAGAEGIDSTADGKYVLVSNGDAGTLTVIDSKKLEPVKTLEVGKGPYRVRALPDSKRALVPNIEGGDMAEVDLAKLEVTRRLELGKDPIGIVASADSKRVWVASSGSDIIHVVDTEAWKTLGTVTAGDEPDGMAFVKAPVADRTGSNKAVKK
jgi:YVTN family beta-propeller protein